MPRYRARNHYYVGTVKYSWKPDTVVVTRICQDRCVDTVHASPYVEEDGFDLFTIHGHPARLSYWRNGDHGYVTQVNALPFLFPSGYNGANGNWHIDPNAWITEALNKVQDSGPVTSLPLAIAELKDLPRTARSIHEALQGTGRGATGLYLSQVYAVDPFVADLKSLLGAQREIAERVASHRRKAKTRHASGSLSQQARWTPNISSGGMTGNMFPGAYVWFTREWQPRHQPWYTARIEPTGDLPELLEKIATNPFNMGTPTISDLYNLVPYSFLVDYFSTLGEYVEHQSNLMPYKVKSLCVMCDTSVKFKDVLTKAVSQQSWYPLQGLTNVTGSYTTRRQFRWVIKNPTPVFAWRPLIGARQAANMAALATHFAMGGRSPAR